MIFYCIPTYKSFAECAAAIDRLSLSTVKPDQIIVIDNSVGPGTTYLTPLMERFKSLHIWPQTENLGVAKSWNKFHHEIHDDYVIIANDDTYVHPQTIEILVNAAQESPNEVLFTGSGHSGNIFSLFLLTKRGFGEIGPFDEEFSPAYFEDNDYVRRTIVAGYYPQVIQDARFDHVGSSTLRKYNSAELEAHHRQFRKNQEYYIRKWGGLPWQERYTTPFGR